MAAGVACRAWTWADELVLTVNLEGADLHAVDDRLGELLAGVAEIADMHAGPTSGRWILLPP